MLRLTVYLFQKGCTELIANVARFMLELQKRVSESEIRNTDVAAYSIEKFSETERSFQKDHQSHNIKINHTGIVSTISNYYPKSQREVIEIRNH